MVHWSPWDQSCLKEAIIVVKPRTSRKGQWRSDPGKSQASRSRCPCSDIHSAQTVGKLLTETLKRVITSTLFDEFYYCVIVLFKTRMDIICVLLGKTLTSGIRGLNFEHEYGGIMLIIPLLIYTNFSQSFLHRSCLCHGVTVDCCKDQ